MAIIRELFGKDGRGKNVLSYKLSNSRGTTVNAVEIGAAIQSLCVAGRNGAVSDIVLGYDTVGQYEKRNEGNIGVIIGRNANRIKGARFMIKGREYVLDKNEGKNNLNSGHNGYGSRRWSGSTVKDIRGDAVRFTLVSPDKDQGMPGELCVSVTYVLTDDDRLIVEYSGISGEDTVVNLTNHIFFNLAGHSSGSALEQKVWIDADEYTPVGADRIPTGEYRKVKGTPFDFTLPKSVGLDIGAQDDQLIHMQGYDHNFALKNNGEVRLAASLYDKKSGRYMEMYTQLPGIQLYSGNLLDGRVRGKKNCYYQKYGGICLDSQFFPDSVNNMMFESPVVEAGVPFSFVTMYKFMVK